MVLHTWYDIPKIQIRGVWRTFVLANEVNRRQSCVNFAEEWERCPVEEELSYC